MTIFILGWTVPLKVGWKKVITSVEGHSVTSFNTIYNIMFLFFSLSVIWTLLYKLACCSFPTWMCLDIVPCSLESNIRRNDCSYTVRLGVRGKYSYLEYRMHCPLGFHRSNFNFNNLDQQLQQRSHLGYHKTN